MPEQTTHPSQEELSAYSLGQLPPDEAAVIESHISECEPCCETIVGLSSDDTFVGLLQEARQLPTDQTVDQDGSPAKPSSSSHDVPAPLAEHPRYEIVGLIGKGGMGDVYKARHRMMERTVALKIINRELVRKPEAVDRFHREVKTAAQLSHPNIVTAYDAEQAGDVHFLVMEYVDGVDLSHTVKDRGALPIAEACDYIRQAAIGLQYAHERGMVHRDIKPHNLMVTADGTVKILDFGLASLAPEARVGCRHGRSSRRLDGGRCDHGHSGFHLARASRGRPSGRYPQRHLQPRSNAVLPALRPSAVCRWQRHAQAEEPCAGRTRTVGVPA